MVHLRDEALRQVTELKSLKAGTLAIAAHESAAVYLLPAPLRSTQVAAFIDNGGGRLLKPAVGEASSGNLTGTGFGMQTELPYYSTRLRVDVGFPLGPKPAGGTISGDRSPTVYLQAMMRF
jgi:hypothetical protein